MAALLALTLLVTLGRADASTTRSHHRTRHTTPRHSTGHGSRAHRASVHYRGHRRSSRRHRSRIVGQRVMDSGRATQIQQALIQARYLSGSPTGQWDQETQAAMQKYQADNGWQTKIMPDSRALIKLGLGPKQDEGEYATAASSPADTSRLSSDDAQVDTIRTMATAGVPLTNQN